jgi:hypothetical protein
VMELLTRWAFCVDARARHGVVFGSTGSVPLLLALWPPSLARGASRETKFGSHELVWPHATCHVAQRLTTIGSGCLQRLTTVA